MVRDRADKMKYETDRLIIRKFRADDAKKCMESWGRDTGLGRYILGYPMTDLRQMENFVRSLSEQKHAWVLIEKGSSDIVGYVTFDIPYESLKIGEVGYVIGEKYQGHHYSYEALNYLLQVYFTDYDLYLIEAKYNASNIASEKILCRLGFKKEAVLRGRRINMSTGERNDMVICSINREEMESGSMG